MDEWIDIIGKAQEADGYISTNIRQQLGQKRFEKSSAHETYHMGHLLTAACVHYRATGKDNFLQIAKKTADFLCRQWKAEPAKMARIPWNPSDFMGMAEMYRTTHNKDYLVLLKTLVDNRGSRPNPDRDHAYGGTDQTQDRVPLRQEHLAVGHAVTGNYLYCGAADLYAEIGDPKILAALERIWQDIHERKTDITLGVAMDRESKSLSPRGDEVHENFPNAPYLQPNLYSETCANIGAGMFNYRLFLLTGEAKYADWTERMIYNPLYSGVDLQGERFFYCNPVIVVLISWLLYKKKPSKSIVYALMFTMVGVGITTGEIGSGRTKAIVLVLISSLAYVFYALGCSRSLKHTDMFTGVTFVNIGAALGFNLVALVSPGSLQADYPDTTKGWLIIVALAIVGTVFPTSTFFMGLKRIGTNMTSIFTTSEPVFGLACGILILNETMSLNRVIGAAFVIGALLMLSVVESRSETVTAHQ
jgi:uncharacterized membrane protein